MNIKPILLPNPRRLELRAGAPIGGEVEEICHLRPELARPQGYRLVIGEGGIELTGHDEAGLFYARQTLRQLRRQFQDALPRLEIEDWPDFAARGVMLDISRDKVPTMATLYALVDLLSELKINQLQLYMEHTFAYSKHPEVWRDADPMTPEQIRELDRYCRERFVELVPNQNSFGHMERWFKHPRYAPLAETLEEFTFPWGTKHAGGFSLATTEPGSIEFLAGLYDELLPNFSSRMFNVGCDETHDLGLGKSRLECERRGKARVYLDFLLKLYELVKQRGSTMQFWGDIILRHPEFIGDLPPDAIALDWRYEATDPFDADARAFAAAKRPFYVCPGTSSWLSIGGRTDNAIGNLKTAAACGLANGAIGYLNTDWGDLGHLQYLPISYPGFAAGAAFSWCGESNRDLDLAAALDMHVLHDASHLLGRVMLHLGNVYQALREPLHNSSRLFWALVGGPDRLRLFEKVTVEEFDAAEAALEAAIAPLDRAAMQRDDADVIEEEVRNAAAMLRHACRRGRRRLGAERLNDAALRQDLQGIIAAHRRLWLARNRPGGLNDSAARLEARLADYRV